LSEVSSHVGVHGAIERGLKGQFTEEAIHWRTLLCSRSYSLKKSQWTVHSANQKVSWLYQISLSVLSST